MTIAGLIGSYVFTKKVTIDAVATVDGYYPMKAPEGAEIHTTTDELTGEVNAQDQEQYRAYLLKAARVKTNGLVRDLLKVGEAYATAIPDQPYAVWPSQIFTARKATVDELDYLISRNSPYDSPPDYGYGPLSNRGTLTFNSDGEEVFVSNGNRFGVFYDVTQADEGPGKLFKFYGQVHFGF